MKLNKETQYAMLFVLYLARSGRTTIETAALNLRLSKNFLSQVSRRLKLKAIIKSVRGPGGGYELADDIRMIDVLNSIEGNGLLTQDVRQKYMTGVTEERALEHFVSNLGLAMWPILNRKIKNIVQEVVVNEMAKLHGLETRGLEQ